MKYILYILCAGMLLGCDTPFFSETDPNYQTPFEKADGKKSSEYDEVIDYYKYLSKEFASISFKTIGQTDIGKPLHLVIYSPDAEFNIAKYRKDRTVIFINNTTDGWARAGMEATMLLFRNLAQETIKLPENVIVVTIPVYNVSGMLQNSSYNEAGYNLNADFIKIDVENTASFIKIFQEIQPDIFIDNSNTNPTEADSAHSLTYSTSQREPIGNFLGGYIDEVLMPRVSDSLVKRQQLQQQFSKDSLPAFAWHPLLAPTPENISSAMGYVALWDCMAIGIRTDIYHYKPYRQLVEANYEMMKAIIEVANADNIYIKQLKIKQAEATTAQKEYPIKWEIDSTQQTTVDVHTYEIDTITQTVHLDYKKPIVQQKTYYNKLKIAEKVSVPESYIVPKIWQGVIDRLKANNVEMYPLDKDTLMAVNTYKITDFKTLTAPYQGRYQHYNTQVEEGKAKKLFTKGDYLIKVAQPAKRYLLETLEPQAPNSFFNWNFFDIIISDSLPSYPIYRVK